MKSKINLFLWLLPVFFGFSTAFAGNVNCRVYNAENKETLFGATVFVIETHKGTTTQLSGDCQLTGLIPGDYSVQVSYIGFITQTRKITVLEKDTILLEVFLQPGVDLKAVTITGKRRPQYETIQATDAQLRPVESSQEMLRNVPGMFVAQHAGGGKAEQLFLRGFDIDHGTDVNIKVDGMPVNMVSHAHGQGYADLHFVIPELVEYIDFTKGPYYAEQGNFATAGAVELKTKNQLDHSLVKVEAGQFNTYRVLGAIKLPVKNSQSAFLAADYAYSDGYFESSQQFNRINLFGKYVTPLNKKTTLSLTASTFYSQWNASGQIPERAVNEGLITRFGAIDDTEGGTTGRTNFNLQVSHILRDNLLFKQQIFYSRYHFNLFSNFTFFLNDPVRGDQIRQHENRDLAGYNGFLRHESHLLGQLLTSEAGVNFRADQTYDSFLAGTYLRENPVYRQRGNITEMNAGYYLNETLLLTSKLEMTAGLRLDQFWFRYDNQLDYTKQKAFEQTLNPKFSMRYNLSHAISFFGMAGTGFHSNDARVILDDKTGESLPKGLGYEGGMVLKPGEKLLLSCSLWQLTLQNEFVYVGDEGIVEVSGKTRRKGIDASLRYQPVFWLAADMDINYCLPRYAGVPETEQYIPLAPALTSIGGLTVKTNHWQGSLRYRYMGDRPANEENSIVATGYFINDFVVRYVRNQFEIGLTVQNIFNREWKETQFATTTRLKDEPEPVTEIHFIPGTPRFAKLSVGYRF